MEKTAFIHRVMQHGISRAVMLSVALLCMVAQGAWAEDVKYIYYRAVDDGNQVSLNKFNETAKDPTVLTSKLISGNEEDRLYDGWYVLNSSFSYGERIVIYGDVHLILKDGCTLTAEQGIRINTDATLSIYAQSEEETTMGKLVAIETHHDKAAIGGNKNYQAGKLYIHGGNIEANCKSGSKYAAGIGGGYGDGSGMKEITIYGGKVTAIGAEYGAGIGGGKNNNHPGPINIYGGDIKANGGKGGAGIGGGKNRGNWPVNIYDGTVVAEGKGEINGIQGWGSAAIGGGDEGDQTGRIIIYGGTVTANGNYGAGIGGGFNGKGGEIYIYGGTVTANAGISSACIGGGWESNGGYVHISGGTVMAKNPGYGAAIGGGALSEGGIIEITGGHVTAEAYKYYGNGKAQCTIGSGDGKDKQTIILGTNICVRPQSGGDVASNQRIEACMGPRTSTYLSYQWWKVEVYECEHSDLTYSDIKESGHTAHCKYCEYKKEEAHSYVGSNTQCAQCGYGTEADIRTLSFYQTATTSQADYMASGTPYVQGKTIALPACTDVPTDCEFVGWLKQNDTPASIETADNETLLQPGDEYTVDGSETFYARYRYQYTCSWLWQPDHANVTLYVKRASQSGPGQAVSDVTVTSKAVEATATTPGYTVYTATANYKPNGYTYTFTDEQTVVNYTTVELNETDNTTTLETSNGLEAKAALTGRTLYKNDNWNTLCLPFDVADISSSPLAGATIKEFTDVSFKDGTLTLTFADATSIKAGQAYLIKWGSGSNLGPSDLVFTGVTLAKDLCDDEITADDKGSTVTFMGTYKKLSFDADDKSILFLGTGNKLYYPQKGATIGAQRAYFKLNGITAGDLPQQARTFVLDLGDEDNTTGIIEAEANSQLSTLNSQLSAWYTIEGRKLAGKPAQKGLYINKGVKIVIK
ncbi:MAG: hypothetical protein IJ888_09805 [Prevotella sp.]|nr:hypothetical protein [Prevotella sp.]